MNPTDVPRDIMRRTMKNLAFIDRHHGSDGPYEVTQLVNSFLGALAHPWERLRRDLGGKSIDEAVADGWPRVKKERDDDHEPADLGDLIRLIRNALAHGNIEFYPDAAGDIRAIRLINKERGRRTWGAILTIDDLRLFLDRFVKLAEQMHTDTAQAARAS